MNTKCEKQKRINDLILQILQENLYAGSESIDMQKKAAYYCCKLDVIFKDSDFRPHYFEVISLLEKMGEPDENRTSAVKAFIKVMQETLDSIHLETNSKILRKYCRDEDF